MIVTATEERLVSFESGGEPLHAVLHLPAEAPNVTLVFSHPFAEEKKCAHRTMVEAARAFADAGFAVLRFDHRGCGDSPGAFGTYDLQHWREDIAQATDFAAREAGAPVGLLGLRLGATLVAQVAEQRREIAGLVLWEPIIDGERYIKQNLRRTMIKAMMTAHEGGEESDGAAAARASQAAGSVDFDGYQVSEAMREQIAQIDLLEPPPAFPGPALVLNISATGSVAEPMQRLADAYRQGEAIAVRAEPVWQRIGVIDAEPIISATVEWVRRQ